jgi:hypothetical protein
MRAIAARRDRKVVEDQNLRHVRLEVFCLAHRSELSNAELCVANQSSYRRDRITPWYEVSFTTHRNGRFLFLSDLAIERSAACRDFSLVVPRMRTARHGGKRSNQTLRTCYWLNHASTWGGHSFLPIKLCIDVQIQMLLIQTILRFIRHVDEGEQRGAEPVLYGAHGVTDRRRAQAELSRSRQNDGTRILERKLIAR